MIIICNPLTTGKEQNPDCNTCMEYHIEIVLKYMELIQHHIKQSADWYIFFHVVLCMSPKHIRDLFVFKGKA